MRALVLGDGAVRFDAARPEPVAGAGETLVRVLRAGICGTDLELLRGYRDGFRGVPGHEFVGVAESGPLAGRRVAGEINVVCGACAACRAGRRTHCERRAVVGLTRDGAFAERVAVPLANLHAVPDAVSDDAAVFVEPVAAAARVVEQLGSVAGVRAAVVGDGRLGLLVAQVLCSEGADTTVVGRRADKLRVAAGLGLVAVERAAPRSFDVSVDATGSPDGLRRALDLARPEGTVVLKSTCAGDAPRPADWNRVVVDEIRVVGSRCGPFARAIDLLAAGRVAVAPLVTARFPLERGAEAYVRAAEPDALKVLLEIT